MHLAIMQVVRCQCKDVSVREIVLGIFNQQRVKIVEQFSWFIEQLTFYRIVVRYCGSPHVVSIVEQGEYAIQPRLPRDEAKLEKEESRQATVKEESVS